MRTSYAKSDPRNLICKLLLNSLYGKFGMSPFLTEWKLINNSEELFKLLATLPFDFIELGDKMLVAKELVRNTEVVPPLNEEQAIEKIAMRLATSAKKAVNSISKNKKLQQERDNLMKRKNYLQISLPIAAAVTAYARMNIYQYKNYVINNGGCVILLQLLNRVKTLSKAVDNFKVALPRRYRANSGV